MAATMQSVAANLQKVAKLASSPMFAGARRPPAGPARRRQPQRRNPYAANVALRSVPRSIPDKPNRFQGGALRTAHFAPRGHGYYDAFVNPAESMVLGATVGPCTAIEGFARFTAGGTIGIHQLNYNFSGNPDVENLVPVSSNASLIVFNPGSSDAVVAHQYMLAPDPLDPTKAVIHRTEILAEAFLELGDTQGSMSYPALPYHKHGYNLEAATDKVTGRVESIPVRGSLRIRNVTEALAVGGEVRVMRYNGGMSVVGPDESNTDGDMTVQQFLQIGDMMRDTKRAHTFSGSELCNTMQSNTHPADAVRAMTFKTSDSFAQACIYPKYCSLLILIDDFRASSSQINNTYALTMTVQRAARFRPGSLLHSKSTQPTINANKHAGFSVAESVKAPLRAIAGAASLMEGSLSSKAASGLLGSGMELADFARLALPLVG